MSEPIGASYGQADYAVRRDYVERQLHWVIVYLLKRGEPADNEMAHRLMAVLVR